MPTILKDVIIPASLAAASHEFTFTEHGTIEYVRLIPDDDEICYAQVLSRENDPIALLVQVSTAAIQTACYPSSGFNIEASPSTQLVKPSFPVKPGDKLQVVFTSTGRYTMRYTETKPDLVGARP